MRVRVCGAYACDLDAILIDTTECVVLSRRFGCCVPAHFIVGQARLAHLVAVIACTAGVTTVYK